MGIYPCFPQASLPSAMEHLGLTLQTVAATRVVDLEHAGGFLMVMDAGWHGPPPHPEGDLLVLAAGEGSSSVQAVGRGQQERPRVRPWQSPGGSPAGPQKCPVLPARSQEFGVLCRNVSEGFSQYVSLMQE